MRWINTFILAALIVLASGPVNWQAMPGDPEVTIEELTVEAGPKIKAKVKIKNKDKKMILSVQLFAVNSAGSKVIVGTAILPIGSDEENIPDKIIETPVEGGGDYNCVAVLKIMGDDAGRIASPLIKGKTVGGGKDETNYGELKSVPKYTKATEEMKNRIDLEIYYDKPAKDWDAKCANKADALLFPVAGGRFKLLDVMQATEKKSWGGVRNDLPKVEYAMFSYLKVVKTGSEKLIASKVVFEAAD